MGDASIFGGLTQVVKPAIPAPTTTPPPAPTFDHLGGIQVAPAAGASTSPAPPTADQAMKQNDQDTAARNTQMDSDYANNPDQFAKDHPMHYAIRKTHDAIVNSIVNNSGVNAASWSPEIRANIEQHVRGLAENVVGLALPDQHETPILQGTAAPEEGGFVVPTPRAVEHNIPSSQIEVEGSARAMPVSSDMRDQLLNRVQETAAAKGAVQQADRAGAENLANRFVNPLREPNYVYRSRDIGELGVPANEQSHAQLTSSEQQARQYAQPGQRDAVTGKPQEVVRVDLNKVRPDDYTTRKLDSGTNWHKLKRDIPEEQVEKVPNNYHGAAKDAGVEFKGVQQGVPGKHPGLAIFQDPQSGTSVAVKLNEWSPEKLQEHIDAARKRMGK